MNNSEKLNSDKQNLNNESIIDIINKLNVDDSWKKRFKIINQWYDNGVGLKTSQKLMNIPYKERQAVYISICFKNGGFGTFIAAYLFGPLYYLFKGLWLKAIIYTLIVMLIFLAICIFVPTFQLTGGAAGVIFAMLSPFDYFRLKVLNKQW